MKIKCLWIVVITFLSSSVYGQNMHLQQLENSNIQLDTLDQNWLIDNNSFLVDMASLAKMDTTAMNKAIIQISTKLLSNELVDISEDQAKSKKDFITKIIYGALDHHGLEDEKLLSAMSWYNMIVKEIGI